MSSAVSFDRSLFELVTQHWRMLRWRDRRRMLRVFATMEDVRRYRALREGRGEGAALVPLHVRGLAGEPMYARPGTTDAKVLWDVFHHGYHMPPRGWQRVRRILDLGANVGYSAADLAARFPRAEIVAIEMDAANAAMCARNTSHLGERCRVIEAAVWSRCGEIVYGGDEAWSLSVRDALNDSASPSTGRVARAMTIDQILDEAGWDTVDFVKMDIEGAESEVLRCADGWMNRVRSMKIELHPPAEFEACRRVLTSHGFHCKRDRRHPNAIVSMR